MGLDLKLFRSQETLEKIIKSEQHRQRSSKATEKVVKLDLLWRESKQKLDETNFKINSNNSKIKKLWKTDQESAKLISIQNNSLELERKSLEEQEKTLKESLNEALSSIGNLIIQEVPENNSIYSKITSKLIEKSLKDEDLLLKHRIFSEFLSFGQQKGYLLLQTPSLVLHSFFRKVFPFKPCLIIPAKKPKTLLKSPLEAVLLSYYKEKLPFSLKILAQGVYFSGNTKLKQFEKLSFISFCDLKSFEESSREILEDFESALKIFSGNRKVFSSPRPSSLVSNSAGYQIDFFLNLEEGFLKIGTFSIIGDFLSRSGELRTNNKELVQVISASFKYIP